MRFFSYLSYLSFLVRPGVFLVFGLALGYCYGYRDAFSESDTIGAKVSRVVGNVEPETVRAERLRRAAILRDTIQIRAGVVLPPN